MNWISVDERLPNDKNQVACIQDGIVTLGYYDKYMSQDYLDMNGQESKWHTDINLDVDLYPVTHWHELPPLPSDLQEA